MRTHLARFSDIHEQLEPFFARDDAAARAARAELRSDPAASAVLAAVRRELEALERWTPATVDAAIRAGGRATGARGRALFMPLRRALTGQDHGPAIATLVAVMGRQGVLEALEAFEM